MGWVDNKQIPFGSYKVVTNDESWVVKSFLDRVDIGDEAGNIFSIDGEDRCYVIGGPMKDIFGGFGKRVEMPDPLCQCLKDVVREVLIRRID